MKKLLFTLSTFTALTVSAQQRLVLAESFSQASCPPCAAQNPAFQALMEANPTKIIAIKNQTSWPGTDPMNAQNAPDIQARVDYYGITSVPDRIQDGTNMAPTQASIDARYAVPSPYSLNISHTLSSDYDSAFVTVVLTTPSAFSGTTLKLRLAMTERLIEFTTAPGTNGETVFHDVIRKYYPSAAGTSLGATWTAGQTQTVSFAVAIPSYIYKITEIAFVAYVQDDASKEVHQAGYSVPLLLPNIGGTENLTGVTPFSCATGLTNVSVDLLNEGNNVINTADVKYQVDGGTVQTAPFTGAIAIAGSSTFTLPAIAGLSSGNHTLKVWMANLNNNGSTTPFGLITKAFSTISAAATTTAVVQPFTSAVFPYANYALTSTSTDNWTRATQNTGCAKFYSYNFAEGTVASFALPPMDMTAIAQNTLTFQVAHAQYSSQYTEKLEVFVSSDCGANWTSVWMKSGATLASAAVSTAAYAPISADWRNETVNLAAYESSAKLFVKFVGTSGYGNNVFVDNINLINGSQAALNETEISTMSVYPNPTTENLTVAFEAEGNYTIALTSVDGKVVFSQTYSNLSGAQSLVVPVASLAGGSYTLSVVGATTSNKQQVTIAR